MAPMATHRLTKTVSQDSGPVRRPPLRLDGPGDRERGAVRHPQEEPECEDRAPAAPHHSPVRRWQVERVDTEPMTPEQYQRAVAALATLVARWQLEHQDERRTNKAA